MSAEDRLPGVLLQDLRELLEKYDLLLGLHAGEPGRTVARRDALRQVAARFPGALREWDRLPPQALARRRARVAALLSAVGEAGGLVLGDLEPWLRYSLEWHGCLRALLAERRSLPAEQGRRLSERAYATIAARHGVSAAVVKQAIFEADSEPDTA